MSESVVYSVRDGVAFVAVAHPPVNSLTLAIRRGVMAALKRARGDDAVHAVVILGRDRTFPTGADAAEFDAPSVSPSLADLCNHIELFEKPVIAAVHGTALGGGFELALAAHYRVSHSAAKIGLPEVRLGMMPRAGATQRMPRLVGAKVALDILLSGRNMPVNTEPGQLFFDTVSDGDQAQAALDFCQRLRTAGLGPRPTRDIRAGFGDPAGYQTAVSHRRDQLAQHPETAPKEIVAAVEAAILLPFEAGLALESTSYDQLVAADQAAALRHAYFAELAARRFSLPEATEVPEITTLCVLGGGALAMQITASALQSGLQVHWGTRDPAPLAQGVRQVEALFDQSVQRGAVTAQRAADLLGRLRHGDSAEMTQGVDIILHAARGQGNVPAPQGSIRAVAMSERVDELGLRFAPPVYAARLVEVIEGPGASPQQVAAGLGLARAMGKVAVQVRSTGDSVAGRMMAALQRAADALVDAGQSPYAIDAALQNWGWTRPPFVTRDLIGLAQVAAHSRGEGAQNWSRIVEQAGRPGRSGGHGFYAYPTVAGAPEADPDVSQLIDRTRKISAPMRADHILMLMIGALANEGARMLEESVVTRVSDIDVVMILAHSFPRWRGGPMKAVDLMGLFAVSRAMERFDHVDRAFWQPRSIFAELIKNGRNFDDVT